MTFNVRTWVAAVTGIPPASLRSDEDERPGGKRYISGDGTTAAIVHETRDLVGETGPEGQPRTVLDLQLPSGEEQLKELPPGVSLSW